MDAEESEVAAEELPGTGGRGGGDPAIIGVCWWTNVFFYTITMEVSILSHIYIYLDR